MTENDMSNGRSSNGVDHFILIVLFVGLCCTVWFCVVYTAQELYNSSVLPGIVNQLVINSERCYI